MPAISASMKTFLESDGFEDAVRRARVFNCVSIDSIKEAMDERDVVIELPKISLGNERGGLNISNKICTNGVFVKEDSDYAPICYHMDTNDVDIKIFEKRNKVFSFICIPAISSRPDYRGYDTLFIELDLLQE